MSHSKFVQVVTSAVEKEGKKWNNFSDRLAPVKAAVDDMELQQTAFVIGPQSIGDSTLNSIAYNSFQSYVSQLLQGGVTEFDELGEALKKIADHYDKTDQVNSVNLDGIFF